MNRILTFVFFIFNLSVSIGKTIHSYTSADFYFNAKVDSILSPDSVNDDCTISQIEIISAKTSKLMQTIFPPENQIFCNVSEGEIFKLEDINFDGYPDFRIVEFIPAGPDIPYLFWKYDPKIKQFVIFHDLDTITSPYFNTKDSTIISNWRGGAEYDGTSTYKYLNGKLTLIREYESKHDSIHPDLRINTLKVLINGEMKLVESKTEKIENDSIEDIEDSK